MANFQTLTNAVIGLKEYHTSTDRDELFAEAVSSSGVTSENESFIYSLLMNFIDGGTRVSEIIKRLNTRLSDDFDAEAISKLLAIYYDAPEVDTLDFVVGTIADMTKEVPLGNTTQPTKSNASVAIIQILSANITPANRFTDSAALLLTAVPTFEWSRSIPIFDLKLILPRPPLKNGRPEALSIFKFLAGGETVSNTTEQDIISAGSVAQNTFDENGEPVTATPFTSSGMELFTAPQTLVNADEDFGTVNYRSAPIIDKFRPLMTLKSLDLNVAPTFGMMSYKSGKLNFVLHDRSRLSEIADLVRPDLYSQVELLMEYGWSHPDGSSDSNNLYGQLINSSRLKEKYGVMNSSFTFTDSGQVDITLEIFMKGVTDFSTTNITQNKEVISLVKGIEKLLNVVSEIKAAASSGIAGTKEVRGKILLDTPSDISDAMTFDADSQKAITAFITANPNSDTVPDASELRSVLINLYGADGKNGKVNLLKETAETSFKQKIKCFDTGEDFPLLALPDKLLEEYSNPGLSTFETTTTATIRRAVQTRDDTGFTGGLELETTSTITTTSSSTVNGGKYMSFAKLLLRFVAEPLASTAKFDEVQLLFYTFNSGAGRVRNSNIGSFPIHVDDFFKAFEDYTTERTTMTITIREFIEYVANNFIEDQTSEPYGMSTLYKSGYDYNKEGELEPPDPKNETNLSGQIEAAIALMDISDGVFRMPQISMYVEALPLGEGDEGAISPNGDSSVSILRIHIFDKVASAHLPLQKLLDSMLDANLGTFGEAESDDKSGHSTKAAKILEQASSAGLLKKIESEVDGSKTYKKTDLATPRAIKDFVSKSAPTLRYGSTASGINTIKVNSLQNPLLNTIHMQRAGLGDPSQAPGTDGGVVPLQMLPTQMTMETFGSPLVNFGQQFFIDLDTGTTVDSIYGVTGLTHHIEQGQFKSSFQLINIDAYGSYRSAVNSIKAAIDFIDNAKSDGTVTE